MSIRAFTAAVVGLLLAGGLWPLRAQSLGEVAKKEEERRKAVQQPSRVYTNKDLADVPPATAPAAGPGQPASASGGTPSAPALAKDPRDPDKTVAAGDSRPKDQAYWAGRKKRLQDEFDRDTTFGDAMQSRVSALQTDFANRGDPAQRSVIQQNLQKALAELDRLKKQITQDQKALTDLDEEARRAGVPPGWLR
jgi:hypothetical protein